MGHWANMWQVSWVLVCVSIIWTQPTQSKVFIVDGRQGALGNDGLTVEQPLKTISECVTKLKHPGDECQVRAGNYHEVIPISKLQGTEDKPIKIVGYGDERPVIDGTVVIAPKKWSYKAKTGMCVSKIPMDITALFYEDDLLTLARWPNALWSSRTVFNNKYWRQAPKSLRGTIVDEGLADSGVDVKGAMAILNIGAWETFVRQVLEYDGKSEFTYDDTFGDILFKHPQYYLEAKLEFLDSPEEWFYEKSTKTLSLILPAKHKEAGHCPNPKKQNLRGRTIDYAFEIESSSYITLANMSFFASNVLAEHHVNNIKLESLDFKFPSSSHRVLQSDVKPANTKLIGDSCSVVNCTFFGSEGAPLQYKGKNMFVHNNDFSINDWAGQGSSSATVVAQMYGGEFSQNTLWYNGKAPGIRYMGRGSSNISYNLIAGQLWGLTQSDGASIQVSPKGASGVQVTHNWIHHSPRKGVRFDGDPGGRNGTISHNVVWQIDHDREIFPKGNNHTITNNVGWMDAANMDSQCTVCVPSSHRGFYMNDESIVLNNAATRMTDGGKVIENNYVSKSVQNEMVDISVHDFRPIPGGKLTAGSVTIGAYEVNPSRYWIPGRQLYKASYPIPSDGAEVKTRSDVMCRTGYLADQHHFYLGESADQVTEAELNDSEYQLSLAGQDNVFKLPEGLVKNKPYYWRVDAQRGGDVFKGDVWQFQFV